MQISKTDYMLYLRHPAWLWIKKHAKELIPPVDDVLQREVLAQLEQYPTAGAWSLMTAFCQQKYTDKAKYIDK